MPRKRAAAKRGARVTARRRTEQRPIRLTAGAGGAATIAAAAGDQDGDGKPKLGTFKGNAYTGAVMEPGGWYGRIVCELSGIKVPGPQRPVLRQHDHEQLVGHTAVEVTDEGVMVDGVFSGQPEHTAKVTVPAGNGFRWQLSIGATPTRTSFLEPGDEAEVNGRTVTGPLTIAHETELGEISFVPLGADGDTSADVQASSRSAHVNKLKAALRKLAGTTLTAAEIDAMDRAALQAAIARLTAGDDAECDDEEEDTEAEGDDDEEEETEADEEEDTEAEEEEQPKAKAKARRKGGVAAGRGKSRVTAAQRRIAAGRKAEAAEARRVSHIKARCQKYGGIDRCKLDNGKTVDLIPYAIENGLSADQAERLALLASRPGAGVGAGPHLHFGTAGELSAEVLECAVFQANRLELLEDSFYRAATPERDPIPARVAGRIKAELGRRYPEKVQDTAHRMFRGRIGLQQLLTVIAREGGYQGRESISDENLGHVAQACMRITADGGSTVSIGNVTSNVLNKFMLQGYLFTEQSWRELAAIRSVKDFKATKSINLFGDVEFQDVGASGELSNATLQDQAFANQVATSGRLITIPRTTIINDDLGALGQVPMLMGRGAGLKLNRAFWTRFMAPGLDDGGSTAFFAAVHTLPNGQVGNSNLSTGGGSALSSAGLTAATLLFDNQVDPKGYPLGLDAEILLYPPDLETAAWELMNSQFIVQSAGATTKQPSENRWKGRYKAVKSRYLNKAAFTGYSAAAWYLLANPSILPVVEVAFLNGQETPTVQAAGPDFQFNVLGLTTRAFFDTGVNMQNFRGGVKSAGA